MVAAEIGADRIHKGGERSGAAAVGVRETTPLKRATSDENSRDKKKDLSSSSPATSLTTISAMAPSPAKES
jgi:hypothetical protein